MNLTKAPLSANGLTQAIESGDVTDAEYVDGGGKPHGPRGGGGYGGGRDLRQFGQGLSGFLKEFRKEAAAAGVSERALSLLDGVEYQPSVIKKDRSQSVFSLSFLQFQARMVSDFRIKEGAAIVKRNKKLFDRIEQTYGVPGEVLVAFWAFETDFGKFHGRFPDHSLDRHAGLGLPPPGPLPRAASGRIPAL
jgi:hypothetical protein